MRQIEAVARIAVVALPIGWSWQEYKVNRMKSIGGKMPLMYGGISQELDWKFKSMYEDVNNDDQLGFQSATLAVLSEGWTKLCQYALDSNCDRLVVLVGSNDQAKGSQQAVDSLHNAIADGDLFGFSRNKFRKQYTDIMASVAQLNDAGVHIDFKYKQLKLDKMAVVNAWLLDRACHS